MYTEKCQKLVHLINEPRTSPAQAVEENFVHLHFTYIPIIVEPTDSYAQAARTTHNSLIFPCSKKENLVIWAFLIVMWCTLIGRYMSWI